MKYYTWEWWSGDNKLSYHDELQKQVLSYGDYFDSMRDVFPPSVIMLSDDYTLHDAELVRLKADFVSSEVTLNLQGFSRDDSKEIQYDLLFLGVVQLATVGNPTKPLGGPGGFGHLGYYEFEVLDNNLYESRMLFNAGVELILQWSDFSVQVKAIENK